MPNLAVANQYAKALHDAVAKSSSGIQPEEALRQIEQFSEALKGSDEFYTILLSPAVQLRQKTQAIGRICDMLGIHGYVKNFLVVVTRNRRLDLLPEIRQRFMALLDESMGLVRVGVSAAQPLTQDQKAALEGALARITGKQVRCGYTVDAALIGGAAVRVGSTMYDGSVRGQLEGLRRRLTSEV